MKSVANTIFRYTEEVFTSSDLKKLDGINLVMRNNMLTLIPITFTESVAVSISSSSNNEETMHHVDRIIQSTQIIEMVSTEVIETLKRNNAFNDIQYYVRFSGKYISNPLVCNQY